VHDVLAALSLIGRRAWISSGVGMLSKAVTLMFSMSMLVSWFMVVSWRIMSLTAATLSFKVGSGEERNFILSGSL
jgi:hypothetical protein